MYGRRNTHWRLSLFGAAVFIFIGLGLSGGVSVAGAQDNALPSGSYGIVDAVVDRSVESLDVSADGFPAFTYHDSAAGTVNLMRCGSVACDTAQDVPVTLAQTQRGSSALRFDGQDRPVIVFSDRATGTVSLMRCNDKQCIGADETVTEIGTAAPDTLTQLSLELANDRPIVSWADPTTQSLVLVSCSDPECSGPVQTTTIANVGAQTFHALDVDSAGLPVLIWSDFFERRLHFVRCSDSRCSNAEADARVISRSSGGYVSLSLDTDDHPRIAYRFGTLRLLACDDPDCAGSGDDHVMVGYGTLGSNRGLTLDNAGNPAIGFHFGVSSNNASVLVRCNDPECRLINGTEDFFYRNASSPNRSVQVALVGGTGESPSEEVVLLDAILDTLRLTNCECQPSLGAPPASSEQVSIAVSCLAGNGRVDVNVIASGGYVPRLETTPMKVEFLGLTARAADVVELDWWRVPFTGRADGVYEVSVFKGFSRIHHQEVIVSCDTDPPVVGDEEVRPSVACRNGLGQVLFQFINSSAAAKPYIVEFEGVPNRSTTVEPWGQARRAVTGRFDGTYQALVRSGGDTVWTGDVTVDCEEARATP